VPHGGAVNPEGPVPAPALAPLFEELGSPVRLALLHRLVRAPGTITALGQEVGLSPQEVSRHLGRLASQGLVARDAARAYAATPYARAILEAMPALESLRQQRAFLEACDLAWAPPTLPMGPLAAARQERAAPGVNLARVARAVAEGQGPLALALPDMAWLAPALARRAARDPLDLVLPWTQAGTDALLDLDAALGEGAARVTVRLAPRVPLALVRDPAEALAILAPPGSTLDPSLLVHGRDAPFLAWADQALDHLREGSLPAYEPAMHGQGPGTWRSALTHGAAAFTHPRRAPRVERPG
jgi:DNA-binding transcriptional ArsR family regulator